MARRGRYRRFLEWVSATRRSRIAVTSYPASRAILACTVPSLVAVKHSEHINYFSTQSLQKLLVGGGFRAVSTTPTRR